MVWFLGYLSPCQEWTSYSLSFDPNGAFVFFTASRGPPFLLRLTSVSLPSVTSEKILHTMIYSLGFTTDQKQFVWPFLSSSSAKVFNKSDLVLLIYILSVCHIMVCHIRWSVYPVRFIGWSVYPVCHIGWSVYPVCHIRWPVSPVHHIRWSVNPVCHIGWSV